MFENTVLIVADQCGVQDAYFCNGTLFFPNTMENSENVAKLQLIFPNTKVSNCGDEKAVDFVA